MFVRRDLDESRRRTGGKRHFQPLDNRAGDLVLHVENVCDLAIVAFRPDMKPAGRIDQLRHDSHTSARLAYAAFQQMAYIQPPGDVSDLDRFALERERRGSSGDVKALDLREGIDDLFRDAVAEVLIVGVRAHAGEWQDGDGRRLLDAARRTACLSAAWTSSIV